MATALGDSAPKITKVIMVTCCRPNKLDFLRLPASGAAYIFEHTVLLMDLLPVVESQWPGSASSQDPQPQIQVSININVHLVYMFGFCGHSTVYIQVH
jgi:hypothetical protein